MTQQSTASEVRDAITWKYEDKSTRISAMLNAYADLLAAQERAVPVAYAAGLEANMRGFLDVMAWPEGEFTIPLYTHAAPADAERLAEALRNLVEASHYADAPDEHEAAEAALATHYAQAQPPAARVPDAMVERALSARVPGGAQVWHWLPDECGRHPHPTAYAIMRAALEAALATQEKPNDSQRLEFIVKYNWIGAKTRCDYHIPDGDLAQTRWAIDAAMLAAQENPNG